VVIVAALILLVFSKQKYGLHPDVSGFSEAFAASGLEAGPKQIAAGV